MGLRLKRTKLVKLRNVVGLVNDGESWSLGIGFASIGLHGSLWGCRVELSFDLVGDPELLVGIQNVVAPARLRHRTPLTHHVCLIVCFTYFS